MALVVPVDDEHARMMDYARSPEGTAAIAKAQAEIDAGGGIVADDAYFENLKLRRSNGGRAHRQSMRRIVLAPSFDEEFFAISTCIEDRFGQRLPMHSKSISGASR